jgi:lipid-A-disaccharide synthase
MWPAFREAGKRLLEARTVDRVLVATLAGRSYPEPGAASLVENQPALVWAAADAALVKSGTATLEGALAFVPMVVAYRMNRLTGWVARRMIRVPWISLVNLIAKRAVVPELLQHDVNPEALHQALAPLLAHHSPAAARQLEGFREIASRLGEPGAAERVAGMALELLDSRL